ncbi:MAG: iron-containing alcohol dehydrogenase [Acidobacteriota bacterium]|nr:iron-containing alcohol dehydrogenase [Acidobacteriota bacterium]
MSLGALPTTAPAALEGWQAHVRPSRVLFGGGRLVEIGGLVSELGASRVLVVTDPGIVAAGHVARAVRSIEAAGLAVDIFDGVGENPTSIHVEAGTRYASAYDADFLVGLGGGSAMDCAKGVNFLLTNGGVMADYAGFGKASKPMLDSVGVPCTAGTGSEAQSFALITDPESHVKMACGDSKARFTAVVLDPHVLRTAPAEVSAVAGYDALSHAVESYVTRSGNPLSRLLAHEGWRLMDSAFPEILSGDAHDSVWADMLWGAHLAGSAIELSMLGAAHACANPLTAMFDVVHGRAIGLVLPTVVRLNATVCDCQYGDLLGVDGVGAEKLARRLEELRQLGGLPTRLNEVGVAATDVPELARQAMEQWTLRHNPLDLDVTEVETLYRSAL